MACKHHKLIYLRSGGWEVQDQDAGRFGVWQELVFGFIDRLLPPVSSHERREQGVFLNLFYTRINPIYKGSALMN